MRGCDNFCAYCIVPHVRGREQSKDAWLVLEESKKLLSEGFKELTLLGQNVNSYKCGDYDFSRLLTETANLPYKFRLRFTSSHPKDFNDKIIEAYAKSENIMPSLHLPVQSGSDKILAAMNRRYTGAEYLDKLERFRKLVPDSGVSSDIMIGFPGETDADFADTLELVKKARFMNAFMFVYSPRKGTPAAAMQQVDRAVKKERIIELVKLQNSISKEISDMFIGKTEEILIEDSRDGFVMGRTKNGKLVSVNADSGAEIGEFVNVAVTKTKGASLFGIEADN
jgi:tRNA-2-methylthio-N6-dimethylallyladenosine synthase